MTVKLNGPGYEHANRLIGEGNFVDDERDAWSDHHPSTRAENDFIEQNGFSEYSTWFLGTNDEYGEESRRHYEFPFGDFEKMSIAAAFSPQKNRAVQDKYFDIENASADLLAVIEKQARN